MRDNSKVYVDLCAVVSFAPELRMGSHRASGIWCVFYRARYSKTGSWDPAR